MLTKEDRAEIKRLIEEQAQAIDLSGLLDDVEPALSRENLVDATARSIEVLGTRKRLYTG
jgi:hypothetical protein